MSASSPFRRGLALFLCVQPVFWMSNVALAQTLDPRQRAQGEEQVAPWPSTRPGDATGPGGAEPAPSFGQGAPRFGDGGRAESAEQRRERAATALPGEARAVDEPIDPEKYVCGPGDVFELNFWGVQNLKLRVAVDLEGRAFVPKIGYLALGGKTLAQARAELRSSVARYFPKLGFDAALAEPRTFLVQVVNDVRSPGSYPARAVDRVATLLDRAGGLGPGASTRRIEVRRRDGAVLQADLELFRLTGDVKHNPHLLDGDVVRVPYEELAASIAGGVNRPGRYELIGTRDLAELVTLAGGLSPEATRQLPLSVVRRQQDDKQHQQLVDFPSAGLPALPLQHGDGVRVPEFTELQQSVMVVGAIRGSAQPAATGGVTPDEASTTRRLPFVEGDSVRTLLERVGGAGPLADLSGSYVLRAGKSIPVDLYALVMLRDLRADRPVELGDTLVIPFRRRNVVVQGAVFTPGSYPYNPTYGVEQYLSLAGGRNRFAQSLSDVRVVTPDGKTVEYRRDLQVDPGSLVVVPERNFSRAEVVQIALGVASVLVSGVAVVLAARK